MNKEWGFLIKYLHAQLVICHHPSQYQGPLSLLQYYKIESFEFLLYSLNCVTWDCSFIISYFLLWESWENDGTHSLSRPTLLLKFPVTG